MKLINRSKFLSISVIVFSLITNMVFATASPELVNLVLDKTGLNKSFEVFDSTMETVVQNTMATNVKLTQEQKDELIAAFTNNLNSKKIHAAVVNQISNSMHDDELQSVLNLYDLDIMNKVKKLEQSMTDPGVSQEMLEFSNNLGKKSPSKTRLELIERLDKAGKFSEKSASTMKRMMRVMFEGARVLDNKLDDEKTKQSIDGFMSMMDYAAKQQFQLGALFMYKSLSDDELLQYIEILESDNNVKAFNEAVLKGTEVILEDFAKSMLAVLKTMADKNTLA